MTLIDTHCHLQFHAYDADRANVIARARKAHVETMIVVGAQLDSSKNAVSLVQQHDGLFAAIGIHPHHADNANKGYIDELKRLASPKPWQKRVVAIGEIGLDYHHYASNGITDPTVQKRVLHAQITLAHAMNLPIIFHCRDAWTDFLPLVAQYSSSETRKKGVFHCWSGSWEDAEKVIAMGYSLSFAGNVTYPKSSLQEVARRIPLDHLLLETDAPYLAPQAVRGTRNEPIFIKHTVAFLAAIRGEPEEKIATVTTENARRLFFASGKKGIMGNGSS